MFCRECGNKLLSGSKFCDNCGTKVVAKAGKNSTTRETTTSQLVCGNCKHPNSRANFACSNCGSSLTPTNPKEKVESADQSKPTYTPLAYTKSTKPTLTPKPTPAPKPAAKKRGIMHWYFTPLSKYADFSGRASRTEFWMFWLWNVIIVCILAVIEGAFGIAPEVEESVLTVMYVLAIFVPWAAVSVRRLHDINMSGWWLLLAFIPILGWLFVIGTGCTNSDRGENKYGPNPELEVS